MDLDRDNLVETTGMPPPLPKETQGARGDSATRLFTGMLTGGRRLDRSSLAAGITVALLLSGAMAGRVPAWLAVAGLALVVLSPLFQRVGDRFTEVQFQRAREASRERYLAQRSAHVPPAAISRGGTAPAARMETGLSPTRDDEESEG